MRQPNPSWRSAAQPVGQPQTAAATAAATAAVVVVAAVQSLHAALKSTNLCSQPVAEVAPAQPPN